MIALTEITRASSTAADDTYRVEQVPAGEWVVDPDSNICPACHENEAAGPVPLGDPYPSGDTYPPAHPRCRCAVLPAQEVNDNA
jgi:hypothetical protein